MRVSFAGGESRFEGAAARVDLPGALGRGFALGPFDQTLARDFARAIALRVSDAQGTDQDEWATPSAPRAAAVLADCETAKQIEWGADPKLFEPGATPPRPVAPPTTWLSMRDFGLIHSLTPATYTVVFRLVVDGRGQPTGCSVLEFAANVEGIEDDFCRAVLHSARFQPARDAAGTVIPAVSVHVLSFRTDINFRG
jgi:hypothetical protein